MAGRPKKPFINIYRPIIAEYKGSQSVINSNFLIKCPVCGSTKIRTNGTQPKKNYRVEGFKCKNPLCDFLKNHKSGKQFTLASSYSFKKSMQNILQKIVDLFANSTISNRQIAKDLGISPALVSFLYQKYLRSLENLYNLNNLVAELQDDNAISIDERFFRINKWKNILYNNGNWLSISASIGIARVRNKK